MSWKMSRHSNLGPACGARPFLLSPPPRRLSQRGGECIIKRASSNIAYLTLT
jgi:hypothetical protein